MRILNVGHREYKVNHSYTTTLFQLQLQFKHPLRGIIAGLFSEAPASILLDSDKNNIHIIDTKHIIFLTFHKSSIQINNDKKLAALTT